LNSPNADPLLTDSVLVKAEFAKVKMHGWNFKSNFSQVWDMNPDPLERQSSV